jgi:hypothetical protein
MENYGAESFSVSIFKVSGFSPALLIDEITFLYKDSTYTASYSTAS